MTAHPTLTTTPATSELPPAPRKIVHVDMDAFYASVEQRDDPSLRGRPVVVGGTGERSVVCAASYEARRYGIRSAMPGVRARRLCPDVVFVRPNFERYKAVSLAVRAIFARHAALVQPLSLDEAYLDVTVPLSGLPSATAVAQVIRAAIREELQLTASAGVAPNKFLAKLASDWRKPDGLFVIRPHQVEAFLLPLGVGKLPGVGAVMERKLHAAGLTTIAELRAVPEAELTARFGRYGARLHALSWGRDDSPVRGDSLRKSVSAEDTFSQDLPLEALAAELPPLAEKVWRTVAKGGRVGRTVVLKLKTAEFQRLTRSFTPTTPPRSAFELCELAVALLDKVGLPARQRYRLAGVGLSHFEAPGEAAASEAVLDDDEHDEASQAELFV